MEDRFEAPGSRPAPDAARIRGLLQTYSLPVQLPYDKNQVIAAIRMDKKREGDRIKFVLLKDIGRAFVDEVPIEDLVAFFEKAA